MISSEIIEPTYLSDYHSGGHELEGQVLSNKIENFQISDRSDEWFLVDQRWRRQRRIG